MLPHGNRDQSRRTFMIFCLASQSTHFNSTGWHLNLFNLSQLILILIRLTYLANSADSDRRPIVLFKNPFSCPIYNILAKTCTTSWICYLIQPQWLSTFIVAFWHINRSLYFAMPFAASKGNSWVIASQHYEPFSPFPLILLHFWYAFRSASIGHSVMCGAFRSSHECSEHLDIKPQEVNPIITFPFPGEICLLNQHQILRGSRAFWYSNNLLTKMPVHVSWGLRQNLCCIFLGQYSTHDLFSWSVFISLTDLWSLWFRGPPI